MESAFRFRGHSRCRCSVRSYPCGFLCDRHTLVALLSRPLRISLAVPDRAGLPPVLAAGAFSVAAYVALTLGLATGHVAVVVVLSTLASAVTVLLARALSDAQVAKHRA